MSHNQIKLKNEIELNESCKSDLSYSINDLKIPEFNPNLKYDSEFYKLFLHN